MTSRLKHKLELENVNLKSSYLNESFVKIGTPLPALKDTKKDQQEFLPVWQQEVRDEQGRRRFHGAFTGGWSAGYYNSVGSKEGWAPSTFKSSRNNRANVAQRAEDFMDEEDLALMREDRQLENTETFATDAFAGTKEELAGKSLSSALESLVIPAKSSIGQSILQKLGWRRGQGIGPRVTLRKLRIQEGKLGRARAGMEVDEDDREASKHTYAPRDTRLIVYDAKDDKGGLGYEKGRGMGALPGRRPMWGAGTEADEEEDPYAISSSTTDARHYAFDQIEEEDDKIVLGQAGPGPSTASTASRSTGTNQWHDGRPVLTGFVLDPKGVPQDKWWPFPDIPVDWQPNPAGLWAKHGQPAESQPRRVPGHGLTHEQRGAVLGEEPRVDAAKSVFEYISEKDRERLAAFAAAAKANAPPPPPLLMEEAPELPPERATEVVIPPLSPRTASAALNGYLPYTDDDAKQERYRSYLVSQTYNTKHPNPQLLPSTSVDEVNKELEGFAQSARIFKPMSFAMSSRFTSGSTSLAASDMKQPKAGLHLYDASKGPQFAKAQHAEVEVEKVLSPREQAAKDGKYGDLTRVIKDFYPTKLVCRRFHVPDPYKGAAPPEEGTNTPPSEMSLPKNNSLQEFFIHQEGTDREKTPPPAPEEVDGERVPRTLAEVGMANDVNQGRDTLTYVKPSIDIFKAIFASDDEDDDDDEPTSSKALTPAAGGTPKDPYPVEEKPVDLATFKPVFRRATEPKSEDKDAAQKRKEKKEKKKRKGVLSFEVEDGEESVAFKPKKAKPKVEPVEEEWVEKPSPAVAAEPRPPRQASPVKGRKGAADYM